MMFCWLKLLQNYDKYQITKYLEKCWINGFGSGLKEHLNPFALVIIE
jgi:hypothetical protein